MPLHHYLPATFLARFSLDTQEQDRRGRVLYIGDIKEQKIFPSTVRNAGAINNLYSVIERENNPEIIEDLWAGYETNLNLAIDSLINHTIDAKTWIRILVPFVACMLVRGPDFNKRMTRRLSGLGIDEESPRASSSNLNMTRLFELQRLLGPVAVAKWIVAETTGDELLITNDLGYCRFFNPFFKESGMAIPLDHNHVLLIIPRDEGDILNYVDDLWLPIIYYTKLPHENHLELNCSLANAAQRFIFCPKETLAQEYVSNSNYDPKPVEPTEIGFITGRFAVAHEFTWHRLASALESKNLEIDDFPLDWENLVKDWNPYVILPTNLVEFPSAIQRKGNIISARFYDPEGYFILGNVINLHQLKSFETMLEEANKGLEITQSQELKIKFLLAKSDAYLELSQMSDSLTELDKVLAIDPGNLIAKTKKAAIYLTENKMEEAFTELSNVLNKDSSFGLARLFLADYYLKKNKYDCAINEADIAVSCFPKSALLGKVYLIRGLAFHEKGDIEKSIDDYSLAVDYIVEEEGLSICYFKRALAHIDLIESRKLNKSAQEINGLTSDFELELSLKDSGQKENNYFEEIMEDLSHCIKLKAPHDILLSAYDLRGNILLTLGLFEQASEDFIEAEELDRHNPKYPFFLGQILLTECKFEEAIRKFQRAIEIEPCLGEGHSNIGIIHFFLGNTTEAEQHLVLAHSLFGDTSAAGSPFRYLSQIYLTRQEISQAKDYLEKAERIDPRSLHNKLIEAIIKIYEEDYFFSMERLDEIASKVPDKESVEIFKSIPLALLGKEEEAKEFYDRNIHQVVLFNKHLFYTHLSIIMKMKNETAILLEILDDLRKYLDLIIE